VRKVSSEQCEMRESLHVGMEIAISYLNAWKIAEEY